MTTVAGLTLRPDIAHRLGSGLVSGHHRKGSGCTRALYAENYPQPTTPGGAAEGTEVGSTYRSARNYLPGILILFTLRTKDDITFGLG